MSRLRTLAPAVLLLGSILSSPLAAQGTQDTIGGTATAPNRSALAKGNVIEVNKSVLMLSFEMYLSFQGPQNLTFFRYRHHSQQGSYVLDWSKVIPSNGTGAGWYSSGTIVLPMIEGNHYILGVSWPGSLTYHYILGTSGQKFSFGSWYSGRTPTGLPKNVSIGGVDRAQYYQRFNTVPYSKVAFAGQPCKTATSPRMTAAAPAVPGGACDLDLLGAASVPAVFVLVPGPLLPKALPLFGCEVWLNPGNGVLLTLALPTDASGHANINLPIPNDTGLSGLGLGWQALTVEGTQVFFTNAILMTI